MTARKVTRPFVIDIPANSFRNIPTWGDYFRVKTITASATVTIENEKGDRVEQIGLAQDYKFDEPFNQLRVTNDTGGDITVTAIIGFGIFGDNEVAGSVTIDGQPISVEDAPVLAMMQNADDQRRSCNELRTTGYYYATASAALQTIVAPGSNTNGIIVSTASIFSNSPAIRIMAKTTAPASFNDTSALTVMFAGVSSTTETVNDCALPLFIAAGYGLYQQANSASGSKTVSLSYEVL